MRGRLSGLLAHPHLPWIAALLGVALCLPALWTGLAVDDYIQRCILSGQIVPARSDSPLWTLFSFLPDIPEARQWLFEGGFLPWWVHEDLRADFLRPLSAATHMLDYALWPDSFAAQHAHSLMWYALAVAAVALLYRRVMGATAAAGLAGVLFAIDDAHAMAASWLANRNGVIALALGAMAVLSHVRWSQTGRRRWFGFSLAALVTGLLSAEAALGAVAYIVAWQLTLARGSWSRRLLALVPHAALVVAWRAVYSGLGYGATGSTLYVDPGREPLSFALALVERAPLLLMSQWSQLPMDAWMFLPRTAQIALTAAGYVTAMALAVVLGDLIRHSRRARFFVLGMLGALVPICASFPMDRLLLFVGIGAFGLLALLVRRVGWLDDDDVEPGRAGEPAGRVLKGVVLLLLLLHVAWAAVALPLRTQTIVLIGSEAHRVSDLAPADEAVTDQTLVFLNGVDLLTMYVPMTRMVDGGPVPGRIALLSSMFEPSRVERMDDRTLHIRPDDGFLSHAGDGLLRDASVPFAAGDVFDMPDFTAEVLEITADGRPAEVAFTFDEPLESDRLRWVYFRDGLLHEFTPPPVGASIRVDATLPGPAGHAILEALAD